MGNEGLLPPGNKKYELNPIFVAPEFITLKVWLSPSDPPLHVIVQRPVAVSLWSWALLKNNVVTIPDAVPDIELSEALGIVTVVIPDAAVVTVAPEKLIAVRDVPTELPSSLTSIPDTTPVNSLPSP